MTDAYIYAAALLCASCGEAQRKHLDEAFAENGAAPGTDEDDSDRYPQGPYADGGGESDSPQHCDQCGTFLYNPLTGDGYAYLRAQAEMAGAIFKDEDGVDVERSAGKAQEDWDCTRRHGGDEDDDAPLAQWLRYYPEAWERANGYMD
jgi:hypothetical protein